MRRLVPERGLWDNSFKCRPWEKSDFERVFIDFLLDLLARRWQIPGFESIRQARNTVARAANGVAPQGP
ncbi:MAG: hypothetical protein ACE5DK_00220 [Paracoccaceae bacterium]